MSRRRGGRKMGFRLYPPTQRRYAAISRSSSDRLDGCDSSRGGPLSGCCVEPVEDKRRAPDLTGLEAPDRTVYAYRGAMLVEIQDDALDAV